MNSNSAVFGLCSPEGGYPPSQYPTSEQLSAFYGAGGGGGGSGGEPGSPSPHVGVVPAEFRGASQGQKMLIRKYNLLRLSLSYHESTCLIILDRYSVYVYVY